MTGKILQSKTQTDGVKHITPAHSHSISCSLAQMGNLSHLDIPKLCSDPNESVRVALASRGIGLGFLISDPSVNVRIAAVERATKELLLNMIHDPSEAVRVAIVRRNILDPKLFINDPSSSVIKEIAHNEQVARKYVYSRNFGIRVQIARRCKNMEILSLLIEDPCIYVREALAERGYFCDTFVKDPRYEVRIATLKSPSCAYAVNMLASDRDERVRTMVAMYVPANEVGIMMKLVHDHSAVVRTTLAEYCKNRKILDVLLYDRNPKVRAAAIANL